MEKYAIISIIIAIIVLILILLVTQYNKFQWLRIKLDKGETNIYNLLEKKHNILIRYKEFLEKNINVNEEDFSSYDVLNTRLSLNKINDEIEKFNNLINKYIDNNEKLLRNETIIKLNKELININIKINGCKKYYNDNLVLYNNLCNAFPSKIISKIFHYKELEFLNEENSDILKILDE